MSWRGGVIRHRCDGTACQYWEHLLPGTDPEEAIAQAIEAGIPPHQERLF